MDTDYFVNLDNAKGLAEAGYKGAFPQMVWAANPGVRMDVPGGRTYNLMYSPGKMAGWYVAAPTHLAALAVFKEDGWLWQVDEQGSWHARKFVGEKVFGGYLTATYKETPDDLIAGILNHLKGEKV